MVVFKKICIDENCDYELFDKKKKHNLVEINKSLQIEFNKQNKRIQM